MCNMVVFAVSVTGFCLQCKSVSVTGLCLQCKSVSVTGLCLQCESECNRVVFAV